MVKYLLLINNNNVFIFKTVYHTVTDLSVPIPYKTIKELMDRVRVVCSEVGVEEALRVKGILNDHEVLRICSEEKLKKLGYRIVSRDEAPEFIRRVGSPDIIAEKDSSWVLVEVKMLSQLVRYEEAGVKLVLVTNVKKGRDIEVWV